MRIVPRPSFLPMHHPNFFFHYIFPENLGAISLWTLLPISLLVRAVRFFEKWYTTFKDHTFCIHFIRPLTAALVPIFIREIFRIHGMPIHTLLNHKVHFTSYFCKSNYKFLQFSLSYHPQTNRQTERINQSLE